MDENSIEDGALDISDDMALVGRIIETVSFVSESSPVSIEHISSRDDSSPEFVDKISSESSPEMFVDEIPLHREFRFEGLENDWVQIVESGSSTVSVGSSNTVTITSSFISANPVKNNTVKADSMCPFKVINSQNSDKEIRKNFASNLDEDHLQYRKDELIVKSANNVAGSLTAERTESAGSKMNFVDPITECDILNQSNYNLVNKNEQSPVHVQTHEECLKYEHQDCLNVSRTRSLKGEVEKKPGKPSANEREKTSGFLNKKLTSNCTVGVYHSLDPVEIEAKILQALHTEEDISAQMRVLNNLMLLDQTDRSRIHTLLDFVVQALEVQFPGCGAYCFGSSVNGLGTKESDVDIHLDLEDQLNPDRSRLNRKRKFEILEEILRSNSQCTHVQPVPNAKVPVIKFQHLPTGLACDLSFKNKMGVFNSQFIKSCVNMDERFQTLFSTIKFLLKHQGLTGGGGDRINCNRFTSYAVTLMLIFYLQQLENPILPPVAEILELDGMDPEFNINGWIFSFSFQNIVSVNKNLMSLEQLLTGFFEFYSTFYYEFIICPFFGTEITHESFKAKNLSGLDLWLEAAYPRPAKQFRWCFDQNTVYKRGLQIGNPICVQDPFELNHNVTKNVDITTLRRFRKYCCECVNVFTSVHKPSAGIRSQHFPHLPKPISPRRGDAAMSPRRGDAAMSPRRGDAAMSPRQGDAATKNVDLSASVSNQEGILRLINISISEKMFDEYDDRHLIPQAGNSTLTWPSPPTLSSVTSPSRDFGREEYRLTTPSNQLICYLCGENSYKYESFISLRVHLLKTHENVAKKLQFRPVQVIESVETQGRHKHSLGFLQNICCMPEHMNISQEELRFNQYSKPKPKPRPS